METRLFSFEDDNTGETTILALNDSEIQNVYNFSGFYYTYGDIDVSDLEVTEDGKYMISEDMFNESELCVAFLNKYKDVLEFEEDVEGEFLIKDEEVAKDFCFYASLGQETEYGEDSTTYYQLDGDNLTKIDNDVDAYLIGEAHEYWDGNNWGKITLTTDYEYCNYTEVTNDYPNFEDKQFIGQNKSSTSEISYYLTKNSNDDELIIIEHTSYYQGEGTTYTFKSINSDEARWVILSELSIDEINELLPSFINDFIQEFDSSLVKGQKIIIDDSKFTLSYKNELYHFGIDELFASDSYNNKYLILNKAVEKATLQINQRREENLENFLLERIEKLPLDRIFVERDDSILAGNCIVHTDQLITQTGIEYPFAMRADELLKIRNDNYSKRAILKAYKNGHMIKNVKA